LLIFDIYFSGVGRELWKNVATLALNVSGLLIWLLKNKTGWNALSKVMSLFENKQLKAEYEQLQKDFQHVSSIVSPTLHTQNGTVRTDTAAPAPDIQAQLQAFLLFQQALKQ
jgi:hypothetical protein